MGNRSFSAIALAALLAGALLPAGRVTAAGAAQAPSAAAPPASAPQDRARAQAAARAADRIRALQREADALASQERSLLVDLRKLELEREIRATELTSIEEQLAETEAQIKGTIARAAALHDVAEFERPDVEARLVQIYKMGHAGYWRMLLAVDDLRSVGRAYRTAAALTRIDRDRVQRHARTLELLANERKALETKAGEISKLKARATAARAAVERAVAARNALIDSIDARRDLNAQMTSELQAAAQKLQGTVAQLGAGRTADVVSLPLRPFRGALAWPAQGIVVGRYGRLPSSRFGTAIARNGIEISLAEGQPVRAVHEGTVAFADQFTGYGNLVILDHGEGAYSLYGNLSSLSVARGDRVEALGPVGASGRNPSGNPSLYFELRVDGKPVDPLQWLKKQQP
jgi:septal ring factor EnvC (AmiA/AmiB activator)